MTSSGPIFLDEPWGFLISNKAAPVSGGPAMIEAQGSPRVVTELPHELKWSGSTGVPPVAGFPFRWLGKTYQSWHVPCGHKPAKGQQTLHHVWQLSGSQAQGTLVQLKVLARPPEGETVEGSPGFNQNIFINWLVNSFQELGHDSLSEGDSAAGGLVRRSWSRATDIWLKPDSDEPRIELIIKMAKDKALIRVLESISLTPRRILLRVRENTHISRVKELDAACIRHYAKLPGRTAIQRAGSQQLLLAVQRRASHDTLENKVACWTLEMLRRRADRWKRLQADKTRTSDRSRSVAALFKHCSAFRSEEAFADVRVGTLAHPVPANYPLMMEPRYQRVYRAYRELIKYEKIKDEAWTWRRPLWAEAVSQLVSCTLREIWPEEYQSSAYYRTESDRGRWMVTPSSAGPFKTQHGFAFVVDSHDFEGAGGLATDQLLSDLGPLRTLASVGSLGCDLALWWPDQNSLVPIWSVLWTGDEIAWKTLLGSAAQAIGAYQANTAKSRELIRIVKGIVVGTSIDRSDVEIESATHGNVKVVGIPVPMAIDTQNMEAFQGIMRNLRSAIDLAVEIV